MGCDMRLFIFLLLLFSSSAYSYTWKFSGIPTLYPSPIAACHAQYGSTSRVIPHPTIVNAFLCQSLNSSQQWYNRPSPARQGTGCEPSDHIYNSLTGTCSPPPLADGAVCLDESVPPPRVMQAGSCVNLSSSTPQTQCKYFAGTANVQKRTFWIYEGTGPTSDLTVQNLQDKTGCEIAPTGDIKPEADCKYFPPTPAVPYFNEGVLVPGTPQPGAYRCTASSALTGNYTPPSTGSGQIPADTLCADSGSPACTLPALEKKKEQKPCAYSTDSKGNQVCVSSKFEASEGKTKCGYVGSEFKCSEDLNKAVGEGISIATKVETKPQPDGKTKITKTDVQTATSCKGSTCTTKTTTTTTTTIKDGNGTTESVSGTCTGDNCPDKNGNPDGDGDGFGDCTGDDCGEGEGGGADIPFPELEEVPSFAESTTTFFDTVDNSPIPSKLRQLQAPSGGACPTFTGQTELLGPVTYDGHCAVIAGNEDLITLIAKTLWALAAVWIFFG
jgi:hypothetical protein